MSHLWRAHQRRQSSRPLTLMYCVLYVPSACSARCFCSGGKDEREEARASRTIKGQRDARLSLRPLI